MTAVRIGFIGSRKDAFEKSLVSSYFSSCRRMPYKSAQCVEHPQGRPEGRAQQVIQKNQWHGCLSAPA
jgi:hypothetical protein